MAKVAWIYRLNKEQLILELAKQSVDTNGTVQELRSRLSTFIKRHPDKFTDKPDDPVEFDESVEEDNVEAIASTSSATLAPPTTGTPGSGTQAQVATSPTTGTPGLGTQAQWMTAQIAGTPGYVTVHHQQVPDYLDKIRKWGCIFDGRDLYAFLERVDELQLAQGIPDQYLLQGLPMLLKDVAIEWYRDLHYRPVTWIQMKETLRDFFLPASEKRDLDTKIRNCKQENGESIRSFVMKLSTMIRRKGTFNEEEKMDIIYYGMKANYRLHIRREDVQNINDLVHRVEAIESTLKEISQQARSAKTEWPTHRKESPYDRRSHCWRCKQKGHRKQDCTNPSKLFCSTCGKDDVLTRDCCRWTENSAGAESGRTQARPDQGNGGINAQK